MSNHFHILLEVPPMPAGGITDAELLRRLGVSYGENFVESGTAARTMAAYIDLNPVRAITSDTDTGFDAGKWKEASRRYRRYLGMALERKPWKTQEKRTR